MPQFPSNVQIFSAEKVRVTACRTEEILTKPSFTLILSVLVGS